MRCLLPVYAQPVVKTQYLSSTHPYSCRESPLHGQLRAGHADGNAFSLRSHSQCCPEPPLHDPFWAGHVESAACGLHTAFLRKTLMAVCGIFAVLRSLH
eukprot:1141155-Pelagomonas_calceolata.AAC.2